MKKYILIIMITLLSQNVFAKRLAPSKVNSIVIDGIEYMNAKDHYRDIMKVRKLKREEFNNSLIKNSMGVIIARDAKT